MRFKLANLLVFKSYVEMFQLSIVYPRLVYFAQFICFVISDVHKYISPIITLYQKCPKCYLYCCCLPYEGTSS